ncbi:alpha-L-glutamate ligase-like protein [Gilvimarinus agarilyticus]|uniref:alpha-L-glutamate ligase-like protein n=1 Tax=unclassified Gilvimarinus TaxID=2642066 RepID=UPI001C086516|nr:MULTISPECIES: alpha-L-glutamate ligase-like protein [unclassified Gilvimarinus]MBU2884236.1 alpha-L-glutamate ligase-like protein [Gilvimarinus agarilyticus]MDO6569375.1 alpha-L-glutamate ligase-like protein [Gilvimarinus sp. 2_MG-2023]MDO6747529.1 alpha-L-glutamate ligase-like protein [Gilvimarinus sp. 1_MG-2023]
MLISPLRLSKLGMLGMNCRNRDFIGRYNRRDLYPLVDNKLLTKFLAQEHNVATPQLQFVVREQHEIVKIEQQLANMNGFAIKPAKGSGGKGIWVITHREGDHFIKSSGAEITLDDIRRHMSNTLAGLYSLGGVNDEVIVEDLIEIDDCFEGYSFEGVPDIRIVVFHGFPVMAMLRLATHASDGKANLHQGAVGVGLDLATGRCLNAVQHGMPIEEHPDTKRPLKDIKVPDWHGMLTLASRCYDMTELGYIGVDLVLDANRGPELLELNARPGLAIQVANGFGLLPRLRQIEKLNRKHYTQADERVEYVMQHFSRLD